MEGLLKAPPASIEARIAFTEAFFRRLNLRHAETAFRGQEVAEFQCECWQETCNERIAVPAEDWAVVRSQSNRFAVAANHVADHFEAVLTTCPSFWMIEKFGEAGDIADELARIGVRASAPLRARTGAAGPASAWRDSRGRA